MKLLVKRMFAQELKMFAFGCTHFGTESHDHDLWIEFLKSVERTPNAVVFGLGDYTDFARTAWRSHMKTYSEEDTFFESIDEMVDAQLVRPFCAEIKKYCPSFKDKCVLLVEGNHHYKYGSGGRSGQTTTEEICRILNVPYGGLSAWVRLTVYNSRGKTRFGSGRNLNIILNHGQSSSSQNITAALGKLERQTVLGWRNVDVILSSHNHMLGHVTPIQLGLSQKGIPKLIEHQILMVKTGCFKMAYKDGAQSQSFEEKAFFRPQHRGWFECSIRTIRRGRDNHKNTDHEKWEFFNFNS